MNLDWLKDGRKIPDDVMYYIRVMAVHAIRVLGHGPEEIAKAYNFNRHCIYRWLNQYDAGGFESLKSEIPPGATPLISSEMDEWLNHVVLSHTPLDFQYDTNLWTCGILAELLKKEFAVTVSESSVRLHLKKLGLTSQKPEYRDSERNQREIEYFFNVKFTKIQRLAKKLGADIGFQDEAGVGIRTRYGRTWGKRGQTPIVNVSMNRGGYNVMSVVTAKGTLQYSLKEGSLDGAVFIDFLKQIIRGRTNPLILLVDHATFHGSALVRDFVRTHRTELRIFFLPKHAPEFNPDEQVWGEVKVDSIGKQSIKDKKDLKKRLHSVLKSLQKNTKRIISFFQLPETKYAAQVVTCES
jgi:transposase